LIIGFYKIHEEKDCNCKIIKVSNRIWLKGNAGNSQVKLDFIVEVNEKSPTPLNKIRLALSVQRINNLTNLNPTCFAKDLIFNSPHRKTTNDYKVLSKPDGNINYGYIRDDVYKKVKVWEDPDISFFKPDPLEPCCVITVGFPEPIKAGECTEVRISFEVTALFDVVYPSGTYPVNSIALEYFSPRTKGLGDVIGGQNEIKVCPQLDPEDNTHPGGFDIWLYFPPGYKKIGGFNYSYKEKHDEVDEFDGSIGKKRIKIGWKLRTYPGINNRKQVGSGEGINISGLLQKVSEATLENIKSDVKTHGKVALIIGIISIILSIIAITAAIVIPLIIIK
jgi:hypothetical protein